MHFLFDFLLVKLSLLLLFLLYLFVSRALNVSNFEPYSAYLDDISLHESMALDLLPSIIAVFNHFPEHPLWVFEKVFFFDVVKRIIFLILDHFCVLGNPELGVGSAVV